MSDYTVTGNPVTASRGIAKLMRDEFILIQNNLNSKIDEDFFVLSGTEAQGATVNDYVVAVSPALTVYTANSLVTFISTHENTGASTIQVSALAAKALIDVDGNALGAGDIASGALVTAFYDGTDFYLISGNDRAARSGDTYTGTHDFTSGVVNVPNQSLGNNSTLSANTAYVDANVALLAPLNSPALTGIPITPTAAMGTRTVQIASTEFVDDLVTATAFAPILPTQTGNAGKFVATDGTNATWRSITGRIYFNGQF